MKKKLESWIKLIFLPVIFISFSEAYFSDYKELGEDEGTMRDKESWYHSVQDTFYHYMYLPIDYYISSRGVFRLLSILSIGYRNYYEFYLHRRVGDRIDRSLLIFALTLFPVNFIYDVLENRGTSSDSDMTEIKTDTIMGLPTFELEPSELLEDSALYNISRPLRNLGISKITFTSSKIDDEMHLLVELTKISRNDQIFFDIKFPALQSDIYYWIELCCNANTECDASVATPLSLLSEEVINELVLFLDGKHHSVYSKSDFERVKGIDFSVNENLVVVKIQQREQNTAAYAVCDIQAHTLQVKNSHLHFSNQTLVFELEKRLSVESEGWLSYLLKLAAKQAEHIAFFFINDLFFEQIFLGECGICHDAMMSGTTSLATCRRHVFCTSCLNKWVQMGTGKCPYCQ